MKKCNLTRAELISAVKKNVDEEYEYYKNHTMMEQSLKSIWENAGVIYQYTIFHHYIIEMINTFTNKELEYLNDCETLEALVDFSLNILPQKNNEICKRTLNRYLKPVKEIEGGLE